MKTTASGLLLVALFVTQSAWAGALCIGDCFQVIPYEKWKQVGQVKITGKERLDEIKNCALTDRNNGICQEKNGGHYMLDFANGAITQVTQGGSQGVHAVYGKALGQSDLAYAQNNTIFAMDRQGAGNDITDKSLSNVTALANSGGWYVAAGHENGDVSLISLYRDGREILNRKRTISTHRGPVRAIALASDSRAAVSGGDDGSVAFFDVARGIHTSKLLNIKYSAHPGGVSAVAISSNGEVAASGGRNGVKLWGLPQPGQPLELPDTRNVVSLAFVPDTRELIVASEDGTLQVWNAANGKNIARFKTGGKLLWAGLRHVPNGAMVYTVHADMTIRLWGDKTVQEAESKAEEEKHYKRRQARSEFDDALKSDAKDKYWQAMATESTPEGFASLPNRARIVNPIYSTPTIVQFYDYSCAQCAEMERKLMAWSVSRPKDVGYQRFPLMRGTEWLPNLLFLGQEEEFHLKLFDFVQRSQSGSKDYQKRATFYEWLEPQLQGDRAQELKQLKARLAPMTLVERDMPKELNYAKRLYAPAEPLTLVILTPNRKLVTSPTIAGGQAQLIPALERMLEEARKDFTGPNKTYLHPRFSKSVTPEERALFEYDLQTLRSLKLADPTGELRRLFKIKEATGAEIEKWLAQRLDLITKPDDVKEVFTVRKGVRYPNNEYSSFSKEEQHRSYHHRDKKNYVASYNRLYREGKLLNQLLALKVDDQLVTQFGERNGIMVFHETYVTKKTDFWTQPEKFGYKTRHTNDISEVRNFIDSVDRLSTLVHESRHGDGNGKLVLTAQDGEHRGKRLWEGAGAHVDCPPTIRNGAKGGCDRWANGAYRLEAEFLRAVLAGQNDAVLNSGKRLDGQTPYEFALTLWIKDRLESVLGKEDGEDRPESIFDVPQD